MSPLVFFLCIRSMKYALLYFYICFSFRGSWEQWVSKCIQVRIGTEAGSRIVKFGVTSLYVLLLVFGLSKALPSTCVVSTFNLYCYKVSFFVLLYLLNWCFSVPLCSNCSNGKTGCRLCWTKSQCKNYSFMPLYLSNNAMYTYLDYIFTRRIISRSSWLNTTVCGCMLYLELH